MYGFPPPVDNICHFCKEKMGLEVIRIPEIPWKFTCVKCAVEKGLVKAPKKRKKR